MIVHKTAVVDGQGAPGEVIEAAGDRLVVAAGEGAVRFLVLQLPGKKPFTAAEFLRGHRVQPGERISPPADLKVTENLGLGPLETQSKAQTPSSSAQPTQIRWRAASFGGP